QKFSRIACWRQVLGRRGRNDTASAGGLQGGTMRRMRVGIAGLGAVALSVAGAGMAAAVSTGGYGPSQQDCAPNADASSTQAAQPGCHNLKVNVADGSGRRYAQVGSDQEAQNQNPHGVGVLVTPNGQSPGEPASGPAVGAHV